ncbi:MAG TPA: TlyA family RNA methyltransferase [Desulfomonilaceae bacterium]|nr:TlyA family RNA methyltransferase [Desulfomonilaceae bacterium]
MKNRPSKSRLDNLMLEKGLVSSRHRAKALIMAGKVIVDGVRAEKPGKEVNCSASLSVVEDLPYVSRGGLKLGAALEYFRIDASNLSLLDAGASTGGFTDCLLQRGAARVIAVDVGYGQLDWKLRNDPRVTVLERTNIRFLERLPYPVDAAVADLSFISLRLVFPKLAEFLPPDGWLLALVKPQFEVGPKNVGTGGVVKNVDKIKEAVAIVKAAALNGAFECLGEFESPVRGAKGNREFFLYLRRTAD